MLACGDHVIWFYYFCKVKLYYSLLPSIQPKFQLYSAVETPTVVLVVTLPMLLILLGIVFLISLQDKSLKFFKIRLCPKNKQVSSFFYSSTFETSLQHIVFYNLVQFQHINHQQRSKFRNEEAEYFISLTLRISYDIDT